MTEVLVVMFIFIRARGSSIVTLTNESFEKEPASQRFKYTSGAGVRLKNTSHDLVTQIDQQTSASSACPIVDTVGMDGYLDHLLVSRTLTYFQR